MTISQKNDIQAKKKSEWGKQWLNGLKSHSDDLLGKGKKRPTEGVTILLLRPLKIIKTGLTEGATSLSQG